mgnify:CR=1 FL=1|tara:strand:- start:444 stop:770 length:327 start_codon:yes stop_codon:yes gene_type:complete
MNNLQKYDNRKILSDYVQGVRNVSMSTSTQVVLIRHLALYKENLAAIKPFPLKNSIGNEGKDSFETMIDWIDDAVKFDYNDRDHDYKNFHYVLNSSKPTGRKLQKRFS